MADRLRLIGDVEPIIHAPSPMMDSGAVLFVVFRPEDDGVSGLKSETGVSLHLPLNMQLALIEAAEEELLRMKRAVIAKDKEPKS